MWRETALQGLDRVTLDKRRSTLRDHDRVEHQRQCRRALLKHRGDGLDHRGVVQHAGLDRVGADIIEHDLHLLTDEGRIDRQDAVNTLGVLRGQRRDGGRSESAEYRHGLDVGLNTGTAAGVGTGDNQNSAVHSAAWEPAPASSVPCEIVRIASQTSPTTRVSKSSSSPWAITRITGSVPEARMTRRPAAPRRASAAVMARLTRVASSGAPSPKRTLRRSCGTGVNSRQTSPALRPVSTIRAITWSAAIRPSPVVA